VSEPPPTTLAATPYALRTETHDGIATITFDLPGEPVNKINRTVRDELVAVLDRIERDESIVAAVLLSGKRDVWIAGADIGEFLELRGAADAERLSADGQAMIARLERLRVPIVAAIHGACLGGGLEAALACAYRIATDHPRTLLALPEVQLGLIPGAGGTQRLPRVVGLRNALDMILTGKNVRARRALQMGLVDEIVHPAILKRIALERARGLASQKRGAAAGRRRGFGVMRFVIDRTAPGRSFAFRKAREGALAKTQGNYPAPLAAIEAMKAGFEMPREQAFATEARLFGEAASTDVCRQLIYLFFAGNALKKDPGVAVEPVPETLPVERMAVLGSGFMGAGIAGLAAQQGIIVRMKDAEHERVAAGFAAIRRLADERLERKHITRQELSDEMSRVTGTVSYSGFAGADLVVEAVFEDVQIKHQVLRETERVLRDNAIFATNTSTIPIATIAHASARPDRVVGMHFFSPVHRMPLLEVITTRRTDPQVVVSAVAFGRKLGKTVIVVNDGPGFYVNRILAPYLNEAGILLDQGARMEVVDEAMVKFGFPVGPIALMDEVGLDIAGKAGAIMATAFGARMTPARSLSSAVAAGRHGRKNRKGFYRYDYRGKKGGPDESAYELTPAGRQRVQFTAEEIQARLVLAMLNEAARCLADGIIRSARDGDIGAVYGIGFPPFRGGPFRYMDLLGGSDVVRRLEELNHRFPGRFDPAAILLEMSRRHTRFHEQ
jgi:3-hydroxyacyl-CoA dehydrogenase/enoyl-CoA hydratase/3-hydroxybutyryl-CoA epimerase